MSDKTIQAVVVKGLRAASGIFNDITVIGNIEKQKPFFSAMGVDTSFWYNGTINLSIEPKKVKIIKPDYSIAAEWSPGKNENFWLVSIKIEHKECLYDGYIYYPCASLLKAHSDSIVEIITEKVPFLEYGDNAKIFYSSEKVTFLKD